MTTTTKTTTEQSIKWVVFALITQVILSSIHHIYEGVKYASALRSSQPVIAGIELFIVLGLLYWYRQTRSGIALTLFSVVIVLVGLVQGLFHSLYGHVYKDVLFLAGVTADQVRNYFLPVVPNEFIYPPNDIFVEATGVLELVTTYLFAFFTYRLIQNRQSHQ